MFGFASRNERVLRRMRKMVKRINALEESVKALDDVALQAKTAEFKERHAGGESLDKLLPEAFAVVREASVRVTGMRHFDVQMLGGMVLNQGNIAEMRTGEGKTLTSTLPTYLNALSGKGVHVVTVNEYLAQRDADWMRELYAFLGLSVGVIHSGQERPEKQAAYQSDITYGTNNEFGFDYLRDNMAFSSEMRVQRDLSFAVVDEVDSILIDEARTPLIISGPSEDDPALYMAINKLVPQLEAGDLVERKSQHDDFVEADTDYMVDEKGKTTILTERGHEATEKLLIGAGLLQEGESLYDAHNLALMHYINASLRAHALFKRDVDYIVKGGEVIIVDEFTGRTMPGRRWSDGLHQAVEAKEGVQVQRESQTLASITFQNYFRLYDKLSGMTGTAFTEAPEFSQIYHLDCIVIPTNKAMARDDMPDLVYMTAAEKYQAIADDIRDCRERQQPVLVGTTSIETSQLLASLLGRDKIPHEVLNAKQHQREAEIVAQAGRPGAVTIATNMAGRGTDIVLGGNLDVELENLGEDLSDAQRQTVTEEWQQRHQQVLDAGGLHIIGTERHESRRIDNQLRGRSGRQGDPGSTRFYLSLEDNLMRIFAGPRVQAIMQRLGMEQGEAIEHKWVTRAIENAQRKVEGHNFDIRKNLLEYDDVANDQRRVVYEQRDELMASDDISAVIDGVREDVLGQVIPEFIPAGSIEDSWDVQGLTDAIVNEFGLHLPIQDWLDEDKRLNEQGLYERIDAEMVSAYAAKTERLGVEVMRHIEKSLMLQTLDNLWKEHLSAMDQLRKGIHLLGYAQKNPKQEYKRLAFQMFNEMLDRLKLEVLTLVHRVEVRAPEDAEALDQARQHDDDGMEFQHADPSAAGLDDDSYEEEPVEQQQEAAAAETFRREQPKVGRNAACPCGSGKKYKQCHGKLS